VISFGEGGSGGHDRRHEFVEGPLLLDGGGVGWCERFEDTLRDSSILRIWLDAARLGSPQLMVLSDGLVPKIRATASRLSLAPPLCSIESNRVFPIREAEPASVLLRIDRHSSPCGRCRWQRTDCDEWFVEELVKSFALGCQRLGADLAPELVRRYVLAELAPQPGWQWWSLALPDGRRSGVVISTNHEDLGDGEPFAQCVDAVGGHSSHFSCLAARLGVELGCEVRGEVTVGSDWESERRIVRRLHTEGWRIRGLTSIFWLGDPLGSPR
jgi:hypothetical protein